MKKAARLAGSGLLIGLVGNLLLVPFEDGALPFLILLTVVELTLYGIGIKRISDISNESRLFFYLVFPYIVLSTLIIVFSTTFGFRVFTHYIYDLSELITQLAVYFLFLIGFSIAALVLQIKGYRLLARITNVELFNTVANLLKWGMILAVVVVGLLLLMVAHFLAIVGFFLVRDEII